VLNYVCENDKLFSVSFYKGT